jgi:hypothetical protein
MNRNLRIITRLSRAFAIGAAVLLIGTAALKLRVLPRFPEDIMDPLFGVEERTVMLFASVLELLLASVLLFSLCALRFQLRLIALAGFNFLLYHTAAFYVTGHFHSCPCAGAPLPPPSSPTPQTLFLDVCLIYFSVTPLALIAFGDPQLFSFVKRIVQNKQ